ncbi:hypothetical protein PF004_g13931 [Phytophthora fragariae]|uniref:Uncharacterized protein n=1 Tax=Phytophthora fragariae TaxID=53985 RepID=A0A6G0NQS6_9STRA|nr:hypothetical protein PF004_g13931 [Phytophthora fragariae]
MLQGIWNPRHVKQLTATLTEDWTRTADREWTTEEKEMRDLAMAPAKACCDDSIRGWTGRENATLMAYMAGSLDLPHPPNFVKEIMVGDHRAMLEDYHERYLNVTLTANLPPTVRIARYTPHSELFKELFQANTDKRTAANRWVKKTLRFQKPVITLNDTARGPGENTTGTYTPDQLELQYAVRVYDAEKLGLVALSRAMHRFVGAPVLDVEYARAVKTDIYDNRYYTVKFAQVECPEDLNDVTRIEMGSHCITIHHYQTQLRRPCGRCWSPRHGKRKCTVAEGKVVHVRNRYTRVFDGEISKVATSTRANFAADCVETLVGMVKAMQDATSQRVPERLKRRMECLEQPTSESDDREEINSVANATASTAHTQVASSVGTDAQKALVDAAGYIVHRSKGFKQAANKSRRGQLSGAVELKGVKATRDDSTQLVPQGKAATADFTQPGLPRMEAQQRKDGGTRKGTHASKTKVSSTKSSARLTAFQREEAREYYEALADTEESDDADNSDSDNELGRDTDMGMDSDGATNERLALPDRDGPMHPCGDRDMGEVAGSCHKADSGYSGFVDAE